METGRLADGLTVAAVGPHTSPAREGRAKGPGAACFSRFHKDRVCSQALQKQPCKSAGRERDTVLEKESEGHVAARV